jgi:HAE1 family hydrophobic/amphiphilic exporter-1
MKLVDIAVRRPVTVWMFVLAVILFGLVSVSRLAVNLLPDLSYPTLTVRTEYLGAAPAEVEQLVSKPIEEAVGIVKGIRKIQSISRAGRSDVILEFDWGTDMDMSALEVREKLDVLFLPLDVKKPLLLRFNPNLDPIVRLGLSRKAETSPPVAVANADLDKAQTEKAAQHAHAATAQAELTQAQLVALRTYADDELRRKLEAIDGVAAVRPDGGLTQEIQILVNAQKLSQLKLDISLINQRLKEQNLNQAGGRLETQSHDYLVRTLNQFNNLDEIRDLYLATVNGSIVRLADVATVQDGFVDRQSIAYVNGRSGIEIALYREGDANTVQVAKAIVAQLSKLQENLPAGYQLELVYDQSTFIADAIAEVKSSAWQGGLLAMLVIYLFLRNAWATLVISISIPLSVVATFNLMYNQQISLNLMSLGGIALAIGMLVDNAIVVLENIARYREQGMAPLEAAKKGASEVSMAVTASTLTTVAVFFPLVFVDGIAGQLFKDQALTVTYALLASLLISLTLIPTMAAREWGGSQTAAPITAAVAPVALVGWRKIGYVWRAFTWVVRTCMQMLLRLWYLVMALLGRTATLLFKPLLWLSQWLLQRLDSGYQRVLSGALRAPRRTLAFTLVLTGGCFSLVPKLGFDLLPAMNQGEFYVDVRLPVGSAIERTDVVLKTLAATAAQHSAVARSYAQAGTGQQMSSDPAIGGSHWGRLYVVMQKPLDEAAQMAVKDALRQQLATLPEVTGSIETPALFSFHTPLEIELSGYDLAALKLAADALSQQLASLDNLRDVKTSLRAGQPELSLQFQHDRLSALGLNAADVAKRVANYIGGEIAGQYSIADRKVDIRVRLAEEFRTSETELAQLIINPGSGTPLPLSAVATISRDVGPSEITRVGQQRVVLVSANIARGDIEQATRLVSQQLATIALPYGVNSRILGQSAEMERSFQSLFFALGLAVFLVYLVMASQFEDLFQPLLILLTVPLAGAGAVLGLYLTDTRVSVVVFIGLIMLAGIVVNNAIVLIDRINQLRSDGEALHTAIANAGRTRLRPVLMTTLTTVLGLLPMVFAGDGAEMRAPMAITVIAGLGISTLLTLLFIPVLYLLTAGRAARQANRQGEGQDVPQEAK